MLTIRGRALEGADFFGKIAKAAEKAVEAHMVADKATVLFHPDYDTTYVPPTPPAPDRNEQLRIADARSTREAPGQQQEQRQDEAPPTPRINAGARAHQPALRYDQGVARCWTTSAVRSSSHPVRPMINIVTSTTSS